MSMRTAIGLAFVVITFLSGLGIVDAAKKFRVQVTINGQEDIIGNLAKLVQEEMLALTDVELVTEKPEWTLEILGVAPRNPQKEPVVFLVSVLAAQRFSQEYWNGVFATAAEAVLRRQQEQKDDRPYVVDKKKLDELKPAWTTGPSSLALEAATKDLMRKQAHYVEGGNDLRAIAKKVVATFNQEQLDRVRKK
jgi:hypothetical protein